MKIFNKLKNKKIIVLILGIILICVIFGIVFSRFSVKSSAINTVEKYAEAMSRSNSKLLASLYYDDVIEKLYNGNEKELINLLDANFNVQKDLDIVISDYEVEENYHQIEKNDYDTYVSKYGLKSNVIEELRTYTIVFDIKNKNDIQKKSSKVIVVKINNNWYFLDVE